MRYFENPDKESWKGIFARPERNADDLRQICLSVFNDVKLKGDEALKEYTLKFDKVALENVKVSEEEFEIADRTVSDAFKEAVKLAHRNISNFHNIQHVDKRSCENGPGVRCWQEMRAIEKVGLYVPGGSAPLFSTVLMLSVPAKIAGCKDIILCTPPSAQGSVNPAILWTARYCGVTAVYKVGGVQAIAAMTYGTESIPKVYKIFGPGNQFVMAAKQCAQGMGLAIDMPAGPSEVMVVADETADIRFVASDLLSQAEHGPDSQVMFVTTDKKLAKGVSAEVEEQLSKLSRKGIASKSLENSTIVYFDTMDEAILFANEYSPEHLILSIKDYMDRVPQIVNAGSVFLGNYSPESAGDYASGTNHTLPTSGYAKAYSGVCLDSYMKKVSFQEITKEGLEYLGDAIVTMAENEYLDAHANAVRIRLNK